MAKLQSNFKNMALSLTCITLVAAAALAGVYMLTKQTIDEQAVAKQTAAISAVLPQHDRIADAEEVNGLNVYKAYTGDKFVGAAVESSADGFGGVQRIMIGFDTEGNIVNYEVLEQQETPGLGTHIVEWFKNADKPGQNIIGRKATGAFAVSKDGGDVDAITAATISSRAFLEAVNNAYAAYTGGETQAATGASQQAEPKTDSIAIVAADTFGLVLGMCPTLATTTSAINGMSMGLATMFVLVCSNVAISLLKNLIPDKVRIPAFIVVIATFVTMVQLAMQAYLPAIYDVLGLFIPLIVVNCIVLGRAEAFAAKNSVGLSALDGLGMGLGFTISLTLIGAIREFFGTGCVFNCHIYSDHYSMLIFVLAPGAFLVLGYVMALVQKLLKK